jgi:hypothetical protein
VLLSFIAVGACKTMTTDPRSELLRAVKDPRAESFLFATSEDESQAIASLTNPAARGVVTLDKGDTTMVLRYTTVRDKKTNTTRTYRSEAVKSGSTLALVVTDAVTGQVVDKNVFPPPSLHPGEPKFATLEDCIKDFNCKHLGELQCEANRTCKNQFAALTCCLTNGQCFSVHLIIPPTRRICQLTNLFGDLEGLVFSQ